VWEVLVTSGLVSGPSSPLWAKMSTLAMYGHWCVSSV